MLSLVVFVRRVLVAVLMLLRLARSRCRSWIVLSDSVPDCTSDPNCPPFDSTGDCDSVSGESKSHNTLLPFSISLTPRKSVAPVTANARAVSVPIPDEQPVIRMTLSESLPSRFSRWMMSRAVGLESPGPLGFWSSLLLLSWWDIGFLFFFYWWSWSCCCCGDVEVTGLSTLLLEPY